MWLLILILNGMPTILNSYPTYYDCIEASKPIALNFHISYPGDKSYRFACQGPGVHDGEI